MQSIEMRLIPFVIKEIYALNLSHDAIHVDVLAVLHCIHCLTKSLFIRNASRHCRERFFIRCPAITPRAMQCLLSYQLNFVGYKQTRQKGAECLRIVENRV